jgi:hypothetical protein
MNESEELVLSLETPDEARRLLDLPAGLHEDVPERVYHARVLGIASKSGLDQVRRSGAHHRAWVAGLLERHTPALNFGKAIHCGVLEPERFARDYVIAPDFGDRRYLKNKQAHKAWTDEHAHATVLRNSDGLAMLGMIRAAVAHPLVSALFEGGVSEVTARWTDTETGLSCKARPDHYRQDLATIVDVKSAADASASAFARDLWNYGYYRQDAFYRAGLRALGAPVEHMVFVAIEKPPPHAISIFEIDEDAQVRGLEENVVLLARLAGFIERDEWPGYPERIQTVSLPPWARERT